MTDEQGVRIEQKLDLLLQIRQSFEKPINAFGEILVEADYVTEAKRLSKNTISRNDKLEKFNEIGRRKILLTLKSVAVVKNRKKKPRRPK